MVLRPSLLVAAIFAATPGAAEARDVPATECDRVAASPHDLDKPEDVAGVPFEALDATAAAIEACEIAIAEHPGERRFLTNLGRLHASLGDEREQLAAYRSAFARGSAVAANNLGAIYDAGSGVPRNETTATRFYRKAANRGLVHAMIEMGDRARLGKGMRINEASAAFWYDQASEAGSADATYRLGLMHLDGIGVRKDEKEGFDLISRAVRMDPGYAEAVHSLGQAYETGSGVEADLKKAFSLYQRAANLGHGDAAADIGRFYAEGLIAAADPGEALAWYGKAAKLGSAYGAVQLADAYSNGQNVSNSYEDARLLYELALLRDPGDELRQYIENRLKALPAERASIR